MKASELIKRLQESVDSGRDWEVVHPESYLPVNSIQWNVPHPEAERVGDYPKIIVTQDAFLD